MHVLWDRVEEDEAIMGLLNAWPGRGVVFDNVVRGLPQPLTTRLVVYQSRPSEVVRVVIPVLNGRGTDVDGVLAWLRACVRAGEPQKGILW